MTATTKPKPKPTAKPKPSHVNGEAKAEREAKAKAEAAAKAAAATKAARIAEANEQLDPLKVDVHAAAVKYAAERDEAEAAHLAFGFALLRVETVLVTYPELELSIRQFCEANEPDLSGPVFGSSPAYRALKAARFAAKVPGGVGATSIAALESVHRVVNVDGAPRKVYAKAKAAAGRGRTVRQHHLEAAADALYPKAEANTPGPAKGSEAAKAGGRAKAAKAATPRNEPTKGEVSEVPDKAVSDITLKASAQRWSTYLATFADEDARRIALSVAAFTVKACTDQGIGATKATIDAEAAKLTKPKATRSRKAAKPTTAKPNEHTKHVGRPTTK